jgi:BirA family biotin operon repressor/biotin-[acetyl-CoA-carboxylase] ligase
LAGALVERLAALVDDYPRTGFAPYRALWRGADYLRGRAVLIEAAASAERGTARGIDDDGALLLELETGGEWQRVISGDVSVRNAG